MNEQRLLNSGGKMLAKRWFRWYSPGKLCSPAGHSSHWTNRKGEGKCQDGGDIIHLVSLAPQTANYNLESKNQVTKVQTSMILSVGFVA